MHFVFGLVKLQETLAFGTMTSGKLAWLRDQHLPCVPSQHQWFKMLLFIPFSWFVIASENQQKNKIGLHVR
jgi:hypothetical protein